MSDDTTLSEQMEELRNQCKEVRDEAFRSVGIDTTDVDRSITGGTIDGFVAIFLGPVLAKYGAVAGLYLTLEVHNAPDLALAVSVSLALVFGLVGAWVGHRYFWPDT